MTRLVAASATDAGRVRSNNQDCALVADGLVAVADGMGGHAGGDVAASIAVEVLATSFARHHSADGLLGAAQDANSEIINRSTRDQNLRGMGTTLSAAAVVRDRDGERLAVINVGDSRVYLRSRGDFVQLTNDHSLVEEMVRHGELTPDEAAVHPHRHILTRVLGIDPSVEVDSWLLEAEPGTRLLLCSDGLTNEVTDDEIAAILDANPDPRAAAEALVATALEHGGSDNVTVVVANLVVDATSADGTEAAATASPSTNAPVAPPAEGRRTTAGSTGPLAVAPPPPAGRAARGRSTGAPAAPPPTGQHRLAIIEAPSGRRRRPRGERIVSLWSVLFVLAFAGVIGGIAGFTEWYVKATYFLGLSHGKVAIFEGRPGGFLWFKPNLVEQTAITPGQVFPPYRPLLRAGMVETSYSAAQKVVSNLTNGNSFLAVPGQSATATTAR